MANYFEITPSIRKLYKDFKTIFVFKFGPKTKKFTPKWQIPLFEKRVELQKRESKANFYFFGRDFAIPS